MRLCDSRNPNSRCAQGCTSDPGFPTTTTTTTTPAADDQLPTTELPNIINHRGDIAEHDIPDNTPNRGDTPYIPSDFPNIIYKRDVSKRDVSSSENLASTEAYQETDGPIRIVEGGDLGKLNSTNIFIKNEPL